MKRIIFAILFCIPLVINAQAVSTGSASFNADSVSTQINLERNEFISALIIPRGEIDSLKFSVYDALSESWYTMSSGGVDYSIQVDSTQATYIPLDRDKFYPIKALKLLMETDIADTATVYYDKRSY